MSVNSICVGDKVKKVALSDGTFGNAPSIVEADCCFECRIDINSGSEGRDTGVASESRTGYIFFSKNPELKSGNYVRWVSRNKKVFSPSILLRITTIDDAEGAPGDDPWLWTATFIEDKQASEMIKANYPV